MTEPVAALYLLDTNILLAYVRRGGLYDRVEATFHLATVSPAPIISVVCEGEIRALAKELNWGMGRLDLMEDLLGYLMVVPLPFADVVERYADFSDFSRRHGRAVGKNDLWIAATAASVGATLLTTDRDFDHLSPARMNRVWVDPS